jgi:hypothetical protein
VRGSGTSWSTSRQDGRSRCVVWARRSRGAAEFPAVYRLFHQSQTRLAHASALCHATGGPTSGDDPQQGNRVSSHPPQLKPRAACLRSHPSGLDQCEQSSRTTITHDRRILPLFPVALARLSYPSRPDWTERVLPALACRPGRQLPFTLPLAPARLCTCVMSDRDTHESDDGGTQPEGSRRRAQSGGQTTSPGRTSR